MSLTNVWVQTTADGLVRADQITGIEAHRTPGLPGTHAHWLLDVVLTTSVGSGNREGWNATALHRTLAQSAVAPEGASVALARLLAELDRISAAGVISVEKVEKEEADASPGGLTTSVGGIRFRFVPFAVPAPDDRNDAEYL